MNDETKPVPNEGTGPLPPSNNEIVVHPHDSTCLIDATGKSIVLPAARAVIAVRNVLALQAGQTTILL